MSSMAQTASASSLKGFSVLQPGLGAPLSWMPAVGSTELAQLIDAHLPGPASAQEKRAAVAADFFQFAAATGESFKYYPVTLPRAAPSPASSASSASPAMSNTSDASSPPPSTPASRTASSRTPAAKPEKTDYSHLPGMKILTTDGQDVTNSLSRGCKSKEQREHAHLMRVLKACDDCKKRKIRCDPSHKRRPSSQASSKAVTKPVKKARKSPSASASQAASAPITSAEVMPAEFTPAADVAFDFDFDLDMDYTAGLDAFPSMDIDELLNLHQTASTEPQDYYGATPQTLDFYLGNDSLYSPAMTGSTTSFNSPLAPPTPRSSALLLPHGDFTVFHDTNAQAFYQAGDQVPSLPYMNSGPHGSDYTDFDLYSPASRFMDEEPTKLKAGGKRKSSPLPAESLATQAQLTSGGNSPIGLPEAGSTSTGQADVEQWHFDRMGRRIVNPQLLRSPAPDFQIHQRGVVAGEAPDGVVSYGDQRPNHGSDGGQDSQRAATTTRLHGSQQHVVSRSSSATVGTLSDGSEGHNKPASALLSSRVQKSATSPHNSRQDVIAFGGSAHTLSRTVCPSQPQAEASIRLSSPSASPCQAPSIVSLHPLPSIAASAPLSRRAVGVEERKIGRLEAGAVTNRRSVTASDELPVNGGLPVYGVQLVGGVSPCLGLADIAGNNSHASQDSCHTGVTSRTTVSALASTETTAVDDAVSGSRSGRAELLCPDVVEGHTVGDCSPTIASTDLGLARPGQHRQVLHGESDFAASSSSPRYLLTIEGGVTTLSSMRQMLGRKASTCSLLTHLAVFGLVSMLLIVGLTSLLQSQSPLLAHLPSSSVVILSLVSTLSPLSKDVDSVRSMSSAGKTLSFRRCQHLGSAAESADCSRVPMACF